MHALRAATSGLGPTWSVVVPLLAAFFGATAGGAARFWLDRRGELVEFRSTAVVMADDLSVLLAHLKRRPQGALGHPGPPSSEGAAWATVQRWSGVERRVLVRGLQQDVGTWNRIRFILAVTPDYQAQLIAAQAANSRSGAVGESEFTSAVDHDDLEQRIAEAITGLSAAFDRSDPRLIPTVKRWFGRVIQRLRRSRDTGSDPEDPSTAA